MHFTYTYIEHEVEKFQEYLDFLFYEVWCKAEGEFDADKLNGNPELKQIYIDLGNIEINAKGGKSADFFNSHIENIYAEFLKLEEDQIENLKVGYKSNNDVEGLCSDKAILPLIYTQFPEDQVNLAKLLKSFYGNLYGSNSPFNLAIFGKLGKKILPDHYEKFMDENDREKCPFCGLNDIMGNNHSYREAYDHYLPKAIYPFNPMNFRNLAPMCHQCNSTYKTTKVPIEKCNPLNGDGNRELAFFPYAEQCAEITYNVNLNSTNIGALTPADIELEIVSEGNEEQIESWKRVFGLEERYKASLCSPDDGKAWVNSIIEGYDNAVALGYNKSREDYYEAQYFDASFQPETEKGFIKAPFLEACRELGVFDTN